MIQLIQTDTHSRVDHAYPLITDIKMLFEVVTSNKPAVCNYFGD
ncbi:hypothetical protein [Mucilaginibacter panaciglaebae]